MHLQQPTLFDTCHSLIAFGVAIRVAV